MSPFCWGNTDQMYSIIRALKSVGLVTLVFLPLMGMAAVSGSGQDPAVPESDVPGSPKSSDQLAREMSNPLAAFAGLSYRAEYRRYQGSVPGADDQDNLIHMFQTVIPFAQNNGKGFVFRFGIPVNTDQSIYHSDRAYPEWRIRQQDPTLNGEGEWELTHGHSDDITFDLVYGGVNETGLILQYGLTGILSTSSDTSNSKQQLILGPIMNIGKMARWGEYGALFSHVFDVDEKTGKNTPDTSETTIRAYFGYGLGNGWQIVSNPVISYDWQADSGNKLALPLGGGVAKTTRIGKMPLRLAAELYNYVESTDRFGPEWLFTFTINPVAWNKYTRK